MVSKDANVTPDSCKPDIPPLLGSCRLSVAILLFIGNVNMYMTRANMSVAIVCMVGQSNPSELVADLNFTSENSGNGTRTNIKQSCSQSSSNETGKKVGEFSWDKTTQGQILGSFFVGYICTQIIGGFLSTRFGGRVVFGWSMLVCAFLTILTPGAARTHVYLLIGVRFLVGICQGVVYPAQQSLLAKWNPPLERSRFGSLSITGAYVGYVLAFSVAAFLCEYGFDGGWPTIFYVFGICGILWFLAWLYFVYDSPLLHPRISESEKFYIAEQSGEKEPVKTKNGLLSALPYVGISVTTVISGNVADCLRGRNVLNTNEVRKLFNTIGCFIPTALVIGAGFMDCTDSAYAVTLLTLGLALTGCQYGGGFMINPLDIAPNYAAIIVGISNTFATLPGFISPITVSELTQNKTREEWQTVFYITAAIYVVGATVFVIFGSGDQQDWDPKGKNKDTHLPTKGGLRF